MNRSLSESIFSTSKPNGSVVPVRIFKPGLVDTTAESAAVSFLASVYSAAVSTVSGENAEAVKTRVVVQKAANRHFNRFFVCFIAFVSFSVI